MTLVAALLQSGHARALRIGHAGAIFHANEPRLDFLTPFMTEPSEDLKLRLLFILHRGLVEVRLLAGMNNGNQVFDLADTLEPIPGLLKDWHDDDFDRITTLLKTYQDKYPTGGFDFLARLGEQDPLPF